MKGGRLLRTARSKRAKSLTEESSIELLSDFSERRGRKGLFERRELSGVFNKNEQNAW